jgi:hypothetical protein
MAYIGASLDEVEKTVSTINVACDTMTGNNSTATLTLSASQGVPESVNNISVYFDGVMQRPTADYTLAYKTVSFVTAPETGVKVTVLSYANEYKDVVSDKTVYGSNIADGAVTAAKQTSLSFGNSDFSGTMDASKLTGALPALDGSNVTGLASGQPVIINAADPTVTANPTNGVGTIWLNSTTGESYCCTDATAGDNVWTNIGSGTGSIALPTNPTNAGSFVTPMMESTTYNYTFAGALDNAQTPAGTVTHYMVDQISNGALTVAAAEVAAGQPHVFTSTAVSSHVTGITFRVRAKDNDGYYSSGVTVTMAVNNDNPPGEINNGGAFADMNQSSSYNYTFAGATDDNGVTHYMVDQISNAALTVTAAEVAAGSAHTFNAGAVGSDTAVTFRVRAKDSAGQYSSGVTVSMTVLNYVYTVATSSGSTNTSGVASGDYIYHTFNSSGSITVSTAGTDNMDFLVIAGGGGGGGANWNYTGAGAGGAGGYRSSVTSNGGNQGLLAAITPQTYTITVGGGQPGANGSTNWGTSGTNSSIGSAVVSVGGGGGGTGRTSGGTWMQGSGGSGYANGGLAGGSGGGGSGGITVDTPIGGGGSGSYGHNGGTGRGDGNGQGGGGGGGAGSAGAPAITGGGNGGNGLSWVDGTSRGGGGGGGMYSSGAGTASSGGGAGGGGHGTQNFGGGGGGANSQSGNVGGNGGDGVVIIRYKYQN